MKSLVLLMAALYSAALIAQSAPSLTARPGLCILPSPDAEQCTLSVQLDWTAAAQVDICLYSSQTEKPLQCWQGADRGRIISEVTASSGVEFWLQYPEQADRLAKVTVQIVRLAQRNPERRRRRHIWSVL